MFIHGYNNYRKISGDIKSKITYAIKENKMELYDLQTENCVADWIHEARVKQKEMVAYVSNMVL